MLQIEILADHVILHAVEPRMDNLLMDHGYYSRDEDLR